jgi:Holliday junction resolvase
MGFIKVRREYGSKGIMDITAIRKATWFNGGTTTASLVHYIQCKHKKKGSAIKSMSKEDKEKLVKFSDVCGAKAVFAYNDAKNKIRLEYLN